MRRIWIAVVIVALLMSGCSAVLSAVMQPSVEELLEQALECYDAGNYEEAILIYTTVIEIEPRNFDAAMGLGRSYRGAGNNAEALEALKTAYDINDSAETAYELGCAYIANGQFAEAESFASGLWTSGKGGNKTGTVLLLSLAAQGKTDDVLELLQSGKLFPFVGKEWRDGLLYMGGYDEEGRCSGYGVGLYSEGSLYVGIYCGEYKQGVRCGQGTWYDREHQGKAYYTGEWADDAPNGYGEYHIRYRDDTFFATRSGNYTDGYENGEMTVSSEDHVASYVSKMGIRQLTGEEYKYEDSPVTWYFYAICKTHDGQCNGNWVIGGKQVNAQWGVVPWGATKAPTE